MLDLQEITCSLHTVFKALFSASAVHYIYINIYTWSGVLMSEAPWIISIIIQATPVR